MSFKRQNVLLVWAPTTLTPVMLGATGWGPTAPREVIVPLGEPWPGTQGKVARASAKVAGLLTVPERGRGDAGGADTAGPLGEALNSLQGQLSWKVQPGVHWRGAGSPGGLGLGVGLDSI